MKYLYTTANKAIAFCVILLLSGSFIQAQKNTDSPYSRYGIGLLNAPKFNGNYGTGGAGIAWRPFQFKPLIYDSLARSNAKLNDRGSNYINPVNPASFSNISLTTFEAALVSRNAQYRSGSQSRTGSNTQLGHMAIAFPVAEKWGVGFGIRPFSFVGYDYSVEGKINDNDVNYIYEGSGGVNELFLGTAFELLQNFSLGVSGKYYFGTITDNRRVEYVGNSANFFNSLDQRSTKVRSLSYELGLQYFRPIKDNYRVIAGAIISTTNELNAERTQIIRSYTGGADNENFRDTALFIDDESITLDFAPRFGIGFALEKKLKWIINLDLKTEVWDNKIADGIEQNTNQVVNLGYEKFTQVSSFGSYFNKMGYRAGLNYQSSIVRINNEDIQQFGISFGIAMPLRKSFSTLNLGVELGRRGKEGSGLTQEEFFNFQIGVTINDKWFIQRKYD